jgi:hypothetical protein
MLLNLFTLAIRNPNPNPDSELVPLLAVCAFVGILCLISYLDGRRFLLNGTTVLCNRCKNKAFKNRIEGQLLLAKRDSTLDCLQCEDCGRR